jgi:hypothetical protein
MTEACLTEQIDRDLFRPMRLHLRGGASIDVPTPFLTAMIHGSLYAAVAARSGVDATGPQFIPAHDVERVERFPDTKRPGR